MMIPQLKLNDGNSIPQLGLGVWKITEEGQCYRAVRHALEVGYRHVDTARIYGNEHEVGQAIADANVPREEIFVTTKLWNEDQGYDWALRAIHESLEDLGLDYVDLYLIHFPVSGQRQDSWKALEKIKADGLAKSIGVSNFTTHHLAELLRQTKTTPALNQVELHPFLYQQELLEYCRERGTVVEAYSPLAHGRKLRDERLTPIAERHGKTHAQVMIRWALEKGTIVIPKSATPHRIEENFQVFDFELTREDLQVMDSMNEDYRTCWDPTQVP